jgi:hypothetical protein
MFAVLCCGVQSQQMATFVRALFLCLLEIWDKVMFNCLWPLFDDLLIAVSQSLPLHTHTESKQPSKLSSSLFLPIIHTLFCFGECLILFFPPVTLHLLPMLLSNETIKVQCLKSVCMSGCS